MPNYDYQCPKCGKVKEVFLNLAQRETAIVPCGDCTKVDEDGVAKDEIVAMTAVPCAPGFTLRGAGFTPKFYA